METRKKTVVGKACIRLLHFRCDSNPGGIVELAPYLGHPHVAGVEGEDCEFPVWRAAKNMTANASGARNLPIWAYFLVLVVKDGSQRHEGVRWRGSARGNRSLCVLFRKSRFRLFEKRVIERRSGEYLLLRVSFSSVGHVIIQPVPMPPNDKHGLLCRALLRCPLEELDHGPRIG